MTPQENELWAEYDKDRSNIEVRNRIVEFYIPMVRKFTWLKAEKKGLRGTNFDSVMSFIYERLIESVSKFDPGRNVFFGTYFGHHIKHAITDWCRNEMCFQRGRDTPEFVGAEFIDDAFSYYDKITTDEKIEEKIKVDRILSVLDDLRLRYVKLCYLEERSMKETGKLMGVTESSVSTGLKVAAEMIAECYAVDADEIFKRPQMRKKGMKYKTKE